MPLYEYRCETCGRTFEEIQRTSDPLLSICQECGGKLAKLVSAPAFQLKGTGWYASDYKAGPAPSEAKDGKPASSEKESGEKSSGDKGAKSDSPGKPDGGSEKSSEKSSEKKNSETKSSEPKTEKPPAPAGPK